MDEQPEKVKKIVLDEDWKLILRKAWSIKFGILSAIFAGVEIILPIIQSSIPRGLFAGLTLLSVTGGLISRLIVQKDLSG